MDWKLEVVVVPVSDVDRAKTFYAKQCGFVVDVDQSFGEDFRVVQPPERKICEECDFRFFCSSDGLIRGYG